MTIVLYMNKNTERLKKSIEDLSTIESSNKMFPLAQVFKKSLQHFVDVKEGRKKETVYLCKK